VREAVCDLRVGCVVRTAGGSDDSEGRVAGEELLSCWVSDVRVCVLG